MEQFDNIGLIFIAILGVGVSLLQWLSARFTTWSTNKLNRIAELEKSEDDLRAEIADLKLALRTSNLDKQDLRVRYAELSEKYKKLHKSALKMYNYIKNPPK